MHTHTRTHTYICARAHKMLTDLPAGTIKLYTPTHRYTHTHTHTHTGYGPTEDPVWNRLTRWNYILGRPWGRRKILITCLVEVCICLYMFIYVYIYIYIYYTHTYVLN